MLIAKYLTNRRHGQIKPERVGLQGLKPISFIQRLAVCRAFGIAAVQNVQHDDGKTDPFGGMGNPAQSINEEIAANPVAPVSDRAPDHGDISGRD